MATWLGVFALAVAMLVVVSPSKLSARGVTLCGCSLADVALPAIKRAGFFFEEEDGSESDRGCFLVVTTGFLDDVVVIVDDDKRRVDGEFKVDDVGLKPLAALLLGTSKKNGFSVVNNVGIG